MCNRIASALSSLRSENSLSALIDKLMAVPANADLADYQRLVGEHHLDWKDIHWFVVPKLERYHRAVVTKNDRFEMLILTWMPGQKSLPHNHRDSMCVLKVLQGNLVETTYHVNADQSFHTVPIAYPQGRTLGSEDLDIHTIENSSCANDLLVTLHIYIPALTNMETFKVVGDRLVSSTTE